MTAATDDPDLIVFFDGSSRLTRTRIGMAKIEARRAGAALAWRDVAAEPDALIGYGVDGETARRRLHVLDRDGQLFAGVDALALLASVLPSQKRLARFLTTPGVHAAASLAERVASGLSQRLRTRPAPMPARPAPDSPAP
jgi:predicted DCC family thiol-disulfide oxidoreductase YuxK